jgi:hypothetical protein
VPTTGVREISTTQAVGLSIFLSAVGRTATSHQITFDLKGETDPWRVAARLFGKAAGLSIAYPILTLLIAWVWRTFFMTSAFSIG